jgi:glycosyltransferase involved in cell wall biosynthesis/peptidoglycan/xylan/chitin deacetylase (PgdA/CDA1 family)
MASPVIAHVVLTMNVGGLERLILDLTARSIAAGDRVLIVCLDEAGTLAEEAERLGARVLMMKRRGGPDPRLIARLTALFRREGVTAVHTHSLDPMLYANWAGRIAGVPVRIHTQHLNIAEKPFTRQDRAKFRLAARACTSVVSITRDMDNGVRACGVPASKRLVIYNGIDERRFSPADGPRGDDHVVIGTSCRLSAQKGLDRLLRAFAAVHEEEPAVRLRIIGDGPLRARLEAEAVRLDLTAVVEFQGYCADTAPELRQLDIFALSSLYEGLPLALLEAMACALPVVSTSVNGVPEAVTSGDSGLLVGRDETDRLAAALLRLVRDPQLRETMGRRGRTRVEETFTLDRMAAAYREVYRRERPSRPWKAAVRRIAMACFPASFVRWSGAPDTRRVALTFDDGPDPIYTPKLLEVLRRHGARATFFVIGQHASAHPELVKAMLADGHEVANHSFTHAHFSQLTWREAWQEIVSTESVLLRTAHGQQRPYFRPPRGTIRLATILLPWLARLTVVLWNVDLKDFSADRADQITSRLADRPIRGGDIVLYHGQNPAALEALPSIISSVQVRGLQLVPVSQLEAAS